jgi:type II secretory pathway pseudopilin PulG
MTLTEILVVMGIILVIGSLAIPSVRQVKRRHYEDMAILKLKESANAEKRYLQQYKRFGTYYETKLSYYAPVTGASVRPFIEAYSVRFLVPDRPNSLYFKIVAYPIDGSLGLTSFNINMFLTEENANIAPYQDPPLRKGLDDNGLPVSPN